MNDETAPKLHIPVCWICESELINDECPKCGPPVKATAETWAELDKAADQQRRMRRLKR